MALWIVGGGYLLGSILPAEWLVRRHTGSSPQGQGVNPGAVSTWKIAGLRAGLVVMVLDLLKGAVPIALAGVMQLHGLWFTAAAVAPVVGHNWPIWRFARGGRGVATGTGVLLWLGWQQMLIAYLIGGCFAMLYPRWLPAVAVVALPIGYALMHLHRVPSDRVQTAMVIIVLIALRQVPWLWSKLTQSRRIKA